MEYTIYVTQEFIDQRKKNFELYNAGNRSDRKFLMDLDCEVVEFEFIAAGQWQCGKAIGQGWEVDAIVDGKRADLKFVQKYWNISPRRIVNIIRQRNTIDEYHFWEWVDRPNRPLEAGDKVEVRFVGILSYDDVADNIKPSFKQAGGHYVAIRQLIESK